MDENAEVRAEAAEALGDINDTRAINPLTDMAQNDESEWVREVASEALEKLGVR
ncbi:MAG: HEAT repeat domain-containing protein [Methanothrix sp.]|nr:HEAT repeat domain-containing protein [Methanothrix sp.]